MATTRADTPSLLDELRWRGLLHQTTDERALKQHLRSPRRVYAGFDPTADSLTIGNLVPIMLLKHFQRRGHTPVVVMGGGTGLIGDPSGKEQERPLLDEATICANIDSQRRIFDQLLAGEPAPLVVDNADWLLKLRFIPTLRDIGKHFSVNEMIRRDAVARRIESREQGVSYTEFSYMILQAYDFLHLFRELGVTVQAGGSDQWGNIASGVDLIRRLEQAEAHGLTCPLVVKADGGKFGKTESGAVWLTAERTSPYAYHQFWINAADA
ncbi:MAG: tyrosine--tRNA ligase, partial [Planctomycetota bacterium]